MTPNLRTKKPIVVLDARVLSGSGGGPDKTLINSPPFLEKSGYQMLCTYLHDPSDTGFEKLQAKASVKGTKLISVADRGVKDWRVIPRMLEVCRKNRVDVWHGHDYKTDLLGLILKRFWPMRLITTLHGWVHHTSKTPLYYFIDKATLRYYEHVICVSDDLADAARAARVPPSRLTLLENGIDLRDYQRTKSPSEARIGLGLDPSRFTIGAVGRLSREKGFDYLIRSVNSLIRDGKDLQLLIVGEGDEKQTLQQLIRDLNQENRIKLLGYRNDTIAIYEAMDLYALSSFREGLPNVLLEAMAMKIPIIATAVNGVPKLIQTGTNGVLIQPGSENELANGLKLLIDNEQHRIQFANAGRETVESRYSFSNRMRKLAELYDNLFRTK